VRSSAAAIRLPPHRALRLSPRRVHRVHRVHVTQHVGPMPGALLIADRGNDRMLLVDSRHRILWRFPTARDLERGIHLNFNDDGFIEPGGTAIVSNEEEAHTIVSVNIRTHARSHLYGTPGVPGRGRTSSTHLTMPTCCQTGRSPSPTPTTAASSSSTHTKSCGN
jgi:hypothetical protein